VGYKGQEEFKLESPEFSLFDGNIYSVLIRKNEIDPKFDISNFIVSLNQLPRQYDLVVKRNNSGDELLNISSSYINYYTPPPTLTALFTYTTSSATAPSTASFTNSSTYNGTGTLNYLWTYGSGSFTTSSVDAQLIYLNPGAYTASLSVTESSQNLTSFVTASWNIGRGDMNTYPPIAFYAEYWSSNVSPAQAYFYFPTNSVFIANTSQTPITINNITVTNGNTVSINIGFPFTLSATPYQWNNPNSHKTLTVTNINCFDDGHYIPGANLSDVISIYADGYTLPFIINY
jgi:PKD repeat protein